MTDASEDASRRSPRMQSRVDVDAARVAPHVPTYAAATSDLHRGEIAGYVGACSCPWRGRSTRIDEAIVEAVEHAVGHPVVRGKVVKSGERR